MTRARTVLLIVSVLVGGCSTSDAQEGPPELIVAAAASLTAPFSEIGHAFEVANPGATVSFTFGPSDGLATQILEGAPVDVFASASPSWMDAVDDEVGTAGRADFAKNELAILVPADEPVAIAGPEDLAGEDVRLVLAAEGVPAGDYAREMLENVGVADAALANVVSNEEDVKGVVTKVLSGDADAGIAYATDVTPEIADRIRAVRIPEEVNVIATYPIAVVSGTHEAAIAERFVDFVLGPGQRILADHGFLPA